MNAAVDLACLQAKAGHCVAVVASGGDYESLLHQYGVKYFTLDLTKNPLQYLIACIEYWAIAQTFQPDIVHTHTILGIGFAWLFKHSLRYALVSTIHNEFQRNAILMGLADCVIAVSQAVAHSMERRGIPRRKLRAIANAVIDSPRNRAITEYTPKTLHRPAITTVAGLFLRKGHLDLIQAFNQIAAEIPEVHLYIVGEGPDRSVITAYAQTTPFADRIHFESFQPEPQCYLLSTDIFVLASHHEAFGLALAEAREAGCAVVASYVDGIPEVLEYGRAGILVPVKESEILAKVILQLLKKPKLLQEWRSRSQQQLSWLRVDRVEQETLAVYRELLSMKAFNQRWGFKE